MAQEHDPSASTGWVASGHVLSPSWQRLARSSGRFVTTEIVPRSRTEHHGASPTERMPVFDLSFPRHCASRDQGGGKSLVRRVKFYVFGSSKQRMSKQRCEQFFNCDQNFVLP